MTTTTDKLEIKLSDRPPVRIDREKWPCVAKAAAHDGQIESQANKRWSIRVRQHADGRRIVYGTYITQWQGARGAEGGFLVEPSDGGADDDATVRAIRRVAGIISKPELADECIGDLPAHDLD